MLTPQEVSERAFQKARVGGYNMSQVDEFLDILTGDYSALYNENAVLKSKMKVLVDKVEEYRSTEEAMRKALMAAQRMADDLVKEAEQKKAEILREAEAEAANRKSGLTRELENEEYRLRTARQATAAFVAQVQALYADQQELLGRLDELCPQEEVPAEPDPVDDAANEIDDSVQRLLAQAMMDATAENLKARQAEDEEEESVTLEDTAEFDFSQEFRRAEEEDEVEEDDEEELPVRGNRIDFGSLQFGRDYEIK